MWRWCVHHNGEPADVLRLEEASPPVPGPGEVVLEVDAVGINFPDLLQIRGRYQLQPTLPFTPGQEIVGRVIALGDPAEHHRSDRRGDDTGHPGPAVGDRVLWMGSGGLAEQVVAPAADLLPLPASMPATVAAALLVNYGTARFALLERGHLAPGELVLVHAAAGGVGSAAVQVAKAAGAVVFGVAGGPTKRDLLPGIGVDIAIDGTTEDVVEAVEAYTDGQGVDVVVDPVGGDVFDASTRCLAWGGRLLVVGFAGGRIPTVAANHVLLHNYAVVGAYWGGELGRDPSGRARTWATLCEQWASGEIDPLVGAEVPFVDVPAAFTRLASRASVGKLVVVLADGSDTTADVGRIVRS